MSNIFRILLVVLSLLIGLNQLHTQWLQTNGPNGGEIDCIAIIDSNIFAGTWEGGMFLSTNNGSNWTAVNTGLVGKNVVSIAINGPNIFAGTFNDGVGMYLSTNNGSSWIPKNTGFTNYNISAIVVKGIETS